MGGGRPAKEPATGDPSRDCRDGSYPVWAALDGEGAKCCPSRYTGGAALGSWACGFAWASDPAVDWRGDRCRGPIRLRPSGHSRRYYPFGFARSGLCSFVSDLAWAADFSGPSGRRELPSAWRRTAPRRAGSCRGDRGHPCGRLSFAGDGRV